MEFDSQNFGSSRRCYVCFFHLLAMACGPKLVLLVPDVCMYDLDYGNHCIAKLNLRIYDAVIYF